MTVRIYGEPPFATAVLHGGPGAPGYMAPVAREISRATGVLEPLQSEDSLEGQITELFDQLTAHAAGPMTLIGSSWGAVLALLLAARYGGMVEKLILVGSAVFDAESSAKIGERRLSRLDEAGRRRYERLTSEMEATGGEKREKLMRQWGELLDATDMFDPITWQLEIIEIQARIFTRVWRDFVVLRDRPGALKRELSKVACPAVVIHGDYDPHPIEGIRPFLESCLRSVRFHILQKCGHYPWLERHARTEFFDILFREIRFSSVK